MFRLEEEEEEEGGGGGDDEAVQRAARLLGLSMAHLHLEGGEEATAAAGWGFGGATAAQRVGAALRGFMRLDLGGGGGSGRDAARLLQGEIARREAANVGTDQSTGQAGPVPMPAAACSPVHLLSQGVLGAEVAAVVSAALDPCSRSVRNTGLKALQECVGSEQRRVRRAREAIFVEEDAAVLGEDSKGGDEVGRSKCHCTVCTSGSLLSGMSYSMSVS